MKKVAVIPCLDMKDGKVVKGVQFVDLVTAGDPSELAAFYSAEGADELVFLDISATNEERSPLYEVIKKAATNATIPLCVGGGMKSLPDIDRVFSLGAQKISLNSAAVAHPKLVEQAARTYSSERVVVAIDAARRRGSEKQRYDVLTKGGEHNTGIDLCEWAREAERLGAGSLLVTSKDSDGAKDGYDIELTRMCAKAVDIPVIASGGAGKIEDFVEAAVNGLAQGVLAASVFHFKEISIAQVKSALKAAGVPIYDS